MRTFRKSKIGKTFGRLLVIGYFNATDETRGKWICLCECGNETLVNGGGLTSGQTKSCGCLAIELKGTSNLHHGMSKSTEYNIWSGMKARCYNHNEVCYYRYGGRGITVCERWLNSFENFFDDMGCRPSKKHSLDRIDNDKGYCKENCKWSTAREQANNTRRNVFIELDGIKKSISEWSRKLNIPQLVIRNRIDKGFSPKEILAEYTTPTRLDYLDLTNMVFNRLTVLFYKKDINKWACRCECGNYTDVHSSKLRTQHTQSCGCLQIEKSKESLLKHGASKTSEYNVWRKMKASCYNPNHENFRSIGANGIIVCEAWKDSASTFLKDMGKRPNINYILTRINKNENFEPNNCIWEESIKNKKHRHEKNHHYFSNFNQPISEHLSA